jgi:hypothetical protein
MELEPFELNGRTIRDAHFVRSNQATACLRLEFSDNTCVLIKTLTIDDEITGNPVPVNEVVVYKELL